MIDQNRLSQRTSRYEHIAQFLRTYDGDPFNPNTDPSDRLLFFRRDGVYCVFYGDGVKKNGRYRRRIDWWKDFAVLYDKRKVARRKRIVGFLVKCWGDRDGIDVLTVLIEYLVE